MGQEEEQLRWQGAAAVVHNRTVPDEVSHMDLPRDGVHQRGDGGGGGGCGEVGGGYGVERSRGSGGESRVEERNAFGRGGEWCNNEGQRMSFWAFSLVTPWRPED